MSFRLDKQYKKEQKEQYRLRVEEWIKILDVVSKATSNLGSKLVDTLYHEFHLNETFEDVEGLLELNPKGYDDDFIEWEFMMRERLGIYSRHDITCDKYNRCSECEEKLLKEEKRLQRESK